jgi:uncharacterized protein YodC (DUF2158 family)
MSKFQKGDIVKLKSGGPIMTVQNIGNYTTIEDGVLCVWFSEKKELKEEVFDASVLQKVEQPESSSAQAPRSF